MSDKHYTHQGDETHLELALRRSKPWFEANATFLIYGLAAVLAVVAAIVWMQRQPAANSEISALWMDAQSPEDFQNIADRHEDTKLGILARLKQADSLLNSASRNMFTDREVATGELDAAEKALERLANSSAIDAAMRDRIAIDQARLAEIRCDGTEASVQASADAWQNVLAQNDASIGKGLAESRIARLKDSAASDFYAWFHPLDPKPADDLNMPGFPGGMLGPGPGSSVPEVPPNLDLPILPGLMSEEAEDSSAEDSAPAEESSEAASPSVEEPDAEASSDEEKSADPESASEEEVKPAAADKPAATDEAAADAAPATEEPADGEAETEAGE